MEHHLDIPVIQHVHRLFREIDRYNPERQAAAQTADDKASHFLILIDDRDFQVGRPIRYAIVSGHPYNTENKLEHEGG
ncbi:hypothetical protein PACILC2_44950 [Paenibacillus cisolokensis]|uniref:Uncharacterized protein n=1 Tax=Paenibacillus cisolokensis TaxID=1658519 RepID=A0ABQ4NCG9_9BACL|nr:hypothetical protein PACILC2_44950 [Paenibacillus cisolokensis]